MANANININISSKGAEKSLNTLQADIEATREELDRLIKSYGENSQEADRMRKNLAGLEVEMNKLGGATEMVEQTTQSLKSQLRQMTNELAGLEPGSARFQELSLRAGELRDRIKDTNAVINATAGSGVENFGKALGAATQIGVAGFQGLLGIQALFGTENEDLQRQMVKLTAVLNVAQAISSFGQLNDTFIELKSGINSTIASISKFITAQFGAATSSGAAAVAIEAEGVAAGVAATETTFLSAALNALPFVAIATAIGLAVAGLVSWISSSNEASKAEKQRTENLKRQREEQEKESKTIAETSAEYVGLIYQLKATNAGSKEREKLIKQINATYNTTLQNLTDETAFQKQLNLEVANYIAYQRAKYELQKNEDLIVKNLQRQDEIKKKIKKTEDEIANIRLRQSKMGQDSLEAGTLALSLDEANKKLAIQNAELSAAEKRMASYGKVAVDVNGVINEIEGTTGKYNTTLNTNTDNTNDAADAQKNYEDALRDIQKIIEETTKVDEENYLKTQELSKKKVDLVEIERNKRTESVRKLYEEIKTNINKEITDEKKKYELLAILDKRWAEFQAEMNEQAQLDKSLSNQKILETQKTFIETLLKEEKALQNEIRFGDGDTSDTLIANTNRVLQNSIKAIETEQIRSQLQSDLSLKRYEQLQTEKRDKLILFYKLEQQSQIEAAKAERDRLVDLEKQKYDIKEDFLIEEDKITGKISVKIKEDRIKQFQGGSEEEKKILENLNQEKELLQKNLNTTVENLDKDLNTKLETAAVESANKIAQINADTEDEIFNKRVQKLDQYIDYAQQAFGQFNNIFQQAQELRLQQQQQTLDDYVNYETSVLDQQLANRVITEEEYNARLKQLEIKREQDLLQLKRKQFQQDKAMNIAEATIDAARATLSTFANTPGELIIKSIAAGIAAAFGAAQIALIAKQEFKAAVGGIVPQNGLSGNRDSVSAQLAPGEAVINSNSTNAFLPILDMINRLGGGKSLMPEMPGDNGLNRFQPVYQQGSNQPVRAYVVSSDIENNMSRMNRIRRSTRF